MDTDADWLARYAEHRDQEAFSLLVERHLGLVLGVCRRLVPSADAEDVAQAVFLVLAEKAESVRSDQLRGWLCRTATHISLRQRDAQRARQRRERAAGASMLAQTPAPERADAWPVLDAALGELPALYREPIIGHHLEGEDLPALASRLGISREALSMRLLRGRREMQRILRRMGVTDAQAAWLVTVSTATSETARGVHGANAAHGIGDAHVHQHMPQPAWDAFARQRRLARGNLDAQPASPRPAAFLAAMLTLLAVMAWVGYAAAAHPASLQPPAPRLARTHGRAAPATVAVGLASAAQATASAAHPGVEADLLAIGERGEGNQDETQQQALHVVEFGDAAGHHLATWATAPASVLDTVMSLACSGASLGSVASDLSGLRQLPIRFQPRELSLLASPTLAISQQPLRAILDQLCAGIDLEWSATPAGVVITRASPRMPAAAN